MGVIAPSLIQKRADTRGVRVGNIRSDELMAPQAAPEYTGQPRGRRLKLAVLGLDKELLSRGDPRYLSAIRTASAYRKARTKELFEAHGHVSVGASALLSTASLALAASRFLYEKVAETGNINLLKQASAMADSARQNELAAWELAAREGLVRKKAAAATQGVEWLNVVDGGQKKPGRKRRGDDDESPIDVPALPPVGGDLDSWVSGQIPAGKEDENVVERNRGSTVSVVPGVPGDVPEPDGSADEVHSAAGGEPGAEAADSGPGSSEPEAAWSPEPHGDGSSSDD